MTTTMSDERGSGRTTAQIQNAPPNSVYIWLSVDLWYPQCLAYDLGRDDLTIVSPSWLETNKIFTLSPDRMIVVDHAAHLTGKQTAMLGEYYKRLTFHQENKP